MKEHLGLVARQVEGKKVLRGEKFQVFDLEDFGEGQPGKGIGMGSWTGMRQSNFQVAVHPGDQELELLEVARGTDPAEQERVSA